MKKSSGFLEEPLASIRFLKFEGNLRFCRSGIRFLVSTSSFNPLSVLHFLLLLSSKALTIVVSNCTVHICSSKSSASGQGPYWQLSMAYSVRVVCLRKEKIKDQNT